MRLVSASICFASVSLLIGCGSQETLNIEYTAASGASPQLIAFVSLSTDNLKTREDPAFESGSLAGNPNALIACAKAFGWLDPSLSSGNLTGVDACFGTDGSPTTGLRAHLKSILSAGIASSSLPSNAISPSPFKLVSTSAGTVFVLTFFDLDQTEGNRCFHIAAAEVRSGRFYEVSTGQKSSLLSFTFSEDAFNEISDLSNPSGNKTKCIRF